MTLMLQSIRDRTQGWIAGVIISLLILSFGLWGIHSYLGGGGNNNVIAKVNGVEVTRTQLTATYERLRRQLQMQLGSNIAAKDAEANLKARALQALITGQVLKQASIDAGYRISSQQVDSFLEGMPEFQINSQFSLARFQQFLTAALFTANDFLELIKTSLLTEQPRLGLIFTSFALPDETANIFSLVNQKRDVRYLLIPQSAFSKVKISNEQMTAYYQQHQEEFKTFEQVSIQYIELSLQDLIAAQQVTDKQLMNYYNENSSSYTQKGVVQPFAKVKDQVKAAVARQQAMEKFADLREKLANITYEHPESLQPAADALGLKIINSGIFTQAKGGSDITSNKNVRDTAFSHDVLSAQNNSDVVQVGPESAIVLRVKSHFPAAVLPIDAVQKQIQNKLIAREQEAQAQKAAQEIEQKLRADTSPDKVAQQYSFAWRNTGMVERNSNRVNPAILYAAFRLPQNGKSVYSAVKLPDGYAVVTVAKVENGQVGAKDQYDVFAEQVQNTQGLLEYELYKDSLMKKAKITVEDQE